MTHNTIPAPNEHDVARAARLVFMANDEPGRAHDVIAQLVAEVRWLQNLNHPRDTNDAGV